MSYTETDIKAMTDRELAQAYVAYAFSHDSLGAEFARRFPEIEALRQEAKELTTAAFDAAGSAVWNPADWLGYVPDRSVELTREHHARVRAIAEAEA